MSFIHFFLLLDVLSLPVKDVNSWLVLLNRNPRVGLGVFVAQSPPPKELQKSLTLLQR